MNLFRTSERSSEQLPSKHKMALVTFIGLLGPVLCIPPWVNQFLDVHKSVQDIISVLIIVILMTYFIMPALSFLFASWLEPKQKNFQ